MIADIGDHVTVLVTGIASGTGRVTAIRLVDEAPSTLVTARCRTGRAPTRGHDRPSVPGAAGRTATVPV